VVHTTDLTVIRNLHGGGGGGLGRGGGPVVVLAAWVCLLSTSL